MAKICTLLFFLLTLLPTQSLAYQLRGTVTGEDGKALPYVSVFVENTTYGVATNLKGQYFLELENGTHRVVYQFIGFEKQVVEVTIQGKNKVQDVVLKASQVELNEVRISADKRDPAYPIIKNAIRSRKKYLRQFETYKAETYSKASLEKELVKPNKKDLKDTLLDLNAKQKLNFIESKSTYWYKDPGKVKEIKSGYRDLAEEGANQVSVSVSFDEDGGGYYNAPIPNPYLFRTDLSQPGFVFYKTLMDVPSLGEVPFLSPIGQGALLSYKYRLEESFMENDLLIHKIKVMPRRKESALFEGHVFIVEGQWNLKAVDLRIDRSAMRYYAYFQVIHEYEPVLDSIWVLEREEYLYNLREGRHRILGNTQIIYDQHQINPEISDKFFRNELRITLDEAVDRDSAWWNENRPITLKIEEIEYVHEQDSIRTYHKSEEYLAEQDSITNHHNAWDYLLNGITFRNRFKKRTLWFYPLINQLRPFAVGGYRHAIGGGYNKEFSKAYRLIVDYELNYGFLNEDLRGFGRASYLYQPKKFGRLYAKYGNIYDMINGYESLESTFSRGNYVQKTYYGIGHEMEISNGLFLDVEGEYADRESIRDLRLADWSGELFGENNIPVDFDGYREVLLDVEVTYTYGMKYNTEPYRKVNLGSKYPTAKLKYKKALPGIANSVIDYDFVELGLEQDFQVGAMGESRWKVFAGRFLRGDSIQFVDFKFFRGSDRYFYSNPLRSFQLLGPSISTKNEYFQGHYLHRFNGTLMNKIPLLRKLQLESVVGGGILVVRDNNFRHAELFTGLEMPFRIREQLFKIGVYYVGSDSNHSEIDNSIKFGINFFNSFTNKWEY